MSWRVAAWVGAWLAAGSVAGAMAAGPFVPPNDGPIPFRSDRVPLLVVDMRQISADLVQLAAGIPTADAAGRRGVAQALGLSLALHPGNPPARKVLKSWEDGSQQAKPDPERLLAAVENIWHKLGWLDSESAGRDGRALAACLKDVLARVEADSPMLDAFKGHDEQGSWHGWVPGLAAYRQQEVAKVDPPVEVADPVKAPDPQPRFELTLKQAQIVTPMWKRKLAKDHLVFEEHQRRQEWELEALPLKVVASQSADPRGEPIRLSIGRGDGLVDTGSLENQMLDVLRSQHGSLPRGLVLRVTSDEFIESLRSKRDHSISAVVATLASAVITGREPSAMVIGVVKHDRDVQPGLRFWQKLCCLNSWDGKRIVVAPEAREYLAAMVVMGREQFLLDHEVFFADDYAALLQQALAAPSDAVDSASQKFGVIRDYSKGKNLRDYLANTHVRKRLSEVLQDNPHHASARVLLDEAGGGRASWVSRKVVASEILRVLDPVGQIGRIDAYRLHGTHYQLPDVEGIYQLAGQQLEEAEKYAERDDRELFVSARKVMSALRDLKREIDRRDGDYEQAREAADATVVLQDAYLVAERELMKAAANP